MHIDPEALARLHAPRKRYREQTGAVVKRTNGFYLRYYKDGDGGTRTRVTEFLCPIDTNEKLWGTYSDEEIDAQPVRAVRE